jgi:CDGSH-type Zn-finger protein
MSELKITVRRNGPYRLEGLEGDISLLDEAGNRYGLGGRTVVSLCRCGHSQNKPFCDGSHNRVGFEAESAARDLPPKV